MSLRARLSYAVYDEHDLANAANRLSHTGHLDDLLVYAYDQWKRGEIESATISLSYTMLEVSVMESVFEAMRLIEARSGV